MSYRKILGLVVAAVTTAVLVPSAAEASTGGYVALGDSYASGVGAPPYLDPECRRSDNSYPSLLASSRPFTFNACSGAQTADVLADQLTGLNRKTKLVTLTIGGNDLGFSNGIGVCLQGSDADCLAVVEAAKQFTAEVLPGRLDEVNQAIEQRAPHAKLVVTGYAYFFETTEVCLTVPMSLTKRVALNEAVDALDTAIEEGAGRAGARFADVRPAFTGHGLCGLDPWIQGLTNPDSFHPTAVGYSDGYLPTVRTAVTSRR